MATKKTVPSAAEKLQALRSKGTAKKASASRIKDRVEIELSGPDQESFSEFVSLKLANKEIEARQKLLESDLLETVFASWSEIAWKQKSKPENPSVIVRDEGIASHGIYQLQDSFSLRQFQDAEDPHGAIVEALTAGDDSDVSRLSDEAALDLVNALVIAEPVTKLKYSLSELLEGHFESSRFVEATDEEKAMGEKLLGFLTADADKDGNCKVAALTEEERDYLIVNEARIKLRNPKTFIQQVIAGGYAKNLYQFRRVIATFSPRRFFSGTDLDASGIEKQERIVESVRNVIPMG